MDPYPHPAGIVLRRAERHYEEEEKMTDEEEAKKIAEAATIVAAKVRLLSVTEEVTKGQKIGIAREAAGFVGLQIAPNGGEEPHSTVRAILERVR